jgi:glycosyltransferase involved in cell wall biosynthesis
MINHKTPKVSVLIPSFNEEKYIGKTLEAIMQQNYPHFEVIVVNNNSTDNTAEVVKTFIAANAGAASITSLLHEIRQGTNHARECGRKNATGAIIAQLDADCIPAKNWISQGVRILQKNKTVAVTGPYDYFDSIFFRRKLSLFAQVIFYPFINVIAQLFKRGGIIIGGNSFIKADILNRVGGYNVDLTFYGDDIEIAKRIIPFGKIIYSNKLVLKTSSRRFKAIGFGQVQKKYRKAFLDLMFFNKIKIQESVEIVHPR